MQRIHELCTPDTVEIHSGLALIATVGRGMVRSKGISARLFNALMKAGVNVRLIDQGSSELNIIVGVAGEDCAPCIPRHLFGSFSRKVFGGKRFMIFQLRSSRVGNSL